MLSLIICLSTTFSGFAEVPFLTPPQAIEKMTFPEGFSVKAFAAEPDVIQPFAFCFDARGRIWVAENLNYQTRRSDTFKQGPKGRIIILEDTDGDGVFNTRKVFKDKIFFPSGLALGFGGVWVGSPPNLLFIPDRDGDDVPDGEPEIVLDGWGRHDRHETLNSFLWGPDGWLYGCHGVFTHSKVGKPGTPAHERTPINAGVWRYHPVKKKFEVFAWGTSNPWGMDFDNHGQMFLTACVIPHLWHIIHGGRYHRQGGRHFNPNVFDDIKTIADHRHKSAHGGARFYLADAFPEEYRGRLFMCNIHQHAMLTDVLKRRGSGFTGSHGDDFLNSNDQQWLGFNMEIGPEGAVYVIDWHDADICGRKVHHPETGRIFRVAYNDTKALKDINLAALNDSELVNLQLHNNDWYVRRARRLLHERAASKQLDETTHSKLRGILDNQQKASKKLRALWCLHVTGGATEELLFSLLNNSEEYIRAWSIQLLAEDGTVIEKVLTKWAEMAETDTSAVVRLYLASAMQRVPVEQRWQVLENLAKHKDDADDHNLPLMLWYALEPAVTTDVKRALLLARSSQIPLLTRYVTRRITGGSVKPTKTKSKTSLPEKVAPAKSVSDEGIMLRLNPDNVIADENKITQWPDHSGARNSASQSTAEQQPLQTEIEGRKALTFEEERHLVIKHNRDISFSAADSYTVSAWVYLGKSKGSGWRGIVTKSRDRSPWYGLWIDSGGRWVFGGSGENLAGGAVSNGWHHVCGVQEGSVGRRIYVDGILKSQGRALKANGPGDVWIGGAKSVKEFFQGALGEIRIFKRALSHPEVAFLALNKN